MTDERPEDTNQLKAIYAALQIKLIAELEAGRSAVNHSVAKGDASESSWLAVLSAHLPRRYRVDKAFVVDSLGQQSQQQDIVIYDQQYTPALYNQEYQIVVPAESVYAVFEVRQKFNRENIIYAGGKAASVRSLSRMTKPIKYLEGREERLFAPILAGILTTQSEWQPLFGEPFAKCMKDLNESAHIDLGCIANCGAFDVTYLEANQFSLVEGEKDESLAFFFFALLQKLQSLGTVPAIDYSCYMDTIKR